MIRITFFSDSQVLVNQFLNLAFAFHSTEFVRDSSATSNWSSEQEWAHLLSMARTLSLLSPTPLSVLLTHLVQLCSRWKSQRNTKLSITRNISQCITYFIKLKYSETGSKTRLKKKIKNKNKINTVLISNTVELYAAYTYNLSLKSNYLRKSPLWQLFLAHRSLS